jgi:hypothetical protein
VLLQDAGYTFRRAGSLTAAAAAVAVLQSAVAAASSAGCRQWRESIELMSCSSRRTVQQGKGQQHGARVVFWAAMLFRLLRVGCSIDVQGSNVLPLLCYNFM